MANSKVVSEFGRKCDLEAILAKGHDSCPDETDIKKPEHGIKWIKRKTTECDKTNSKLFLIL